jgi:hypothetical protein
LFDKVVTCGGGGDANVELEVEVDASLVLDNNGLIREARGLRIADIVTRPSFSLEDERWKE